MVSESIYQLMSLQMDSPAVTRIFQQLFARPSRRCLHLANAARRNSGPSLNQYRQYSARRSDTLKDGGSSWQQRIDAFPKDMSRQLKEYPRVTARDLQHRTQRPRRVKMYTREFIEGSTTSPTQESKLTVLRQPIQPQLRLLHKTCDHLQRQSTLQFSLYQRRVRIQPSSRPKLHRLRRCPRHDP